MNKSSFKFNILKVFVFILILFPMLFWFNGEYFFIGHPNGDSIFHLSRIASMTKCIKNGVFLPTVDTNSLTGAGYTINVFYPCLFFYIPALLHLVLPLMQSFIISMICYIGCSYFIFNWLASKYFSRAKVFIFSFVYYTNPYMIFTLEQRLSVSEYIAMLLAPFILLGIYTLIKLSNTKILICSMVLLAHTHLISLLLWSVVSLICIFLFSGSNITLRLKSLVKAGFVSILLSLDFLVPCFYYLHKNDYMISQHKFKFVNIKNEYDLFILLIFFIMILVCFVLYKILLKFNISRLNSIIIPITVFLVYLSDLNIDKISLFDLNVFSFLSQIQFNFRLQVFLWLCVSILLSELFLVLNGKLKVLVICLSLVLSSYGVVKATSAIFDTLHLTNFCFTTVDNLNHVFDGGYVAVVNNEYLPQDVLDRYQDKFDFNTKTIFDECYLDLDSFYDYNVEIIDTIVYNKYERFDNDGFNTIISNPDSETIDVGKIYYPFYSVSQNGNKQINYSNNKGYIRINNIDINGSSIILRPCNTIIQYVSFIISILVLVVICLSKRLKQVIF